MGAPQHAILLYSPPPHQNRLGSEPGFPSSYSKQASKVGRVLLLGVYDLISTYLDHPSVDTWPKLSVFGGEWFRTC